MEKTQIRSLTVRDLGSKSHVEKMLEEEKNRKVRQLTTLRLYHEDKIKEIDTELRLMLQKDVDGIDY